MRQNNPEDIFDALSEEWMQDIYQRMYAAADEAIPNTQRKKHLLNLKQKGPSKNFEELKAYKND